MTRAVRIAAMIALLAFAALCVAATWTVLDIREVTVHAAARIDTLTDSVQQRVDELKLPIATSTKVLEDARLSVKDFDRASIDERFYFEQQVPAAMKRVNAVLDGATDALAGIRQTSNAASMTLDTATDDLRGLQPIEVQAHTTLRDTDALVSSPAWTASLGNIQASTAAMAEGAKQGAAILADGREEADKFVHPPKKKLTLWGAIVAGASVAHKFEPPIL